MQNLPVVVFREFSRAPGSVLCDLLFHLLWLRQTVPAGDDRGHPPGLHLGHVCHRSNCRTNEAHAADRRIVLEEDVLWEEERRREKQ